MQAVTSKVNEICSRYLDNSRLALLPPPPSTPMPRVSAYCIKNCRRKMEDRHVVLHDLHIIFSISDDSPASYYAVFDGHGGQEAAAYSSTHLHQYLVESTYYPKDPIRALRDAFVTTDAHFIEKANKYNLNGGTTAVCALLLNGKLYIAWVGDSLATLTSHGKTRHLVNPHKPDRTDETKRVSDMGGFLVHYGTWRVNGHLSVSRAIGDVKYKPCVTADPEILCVDLNGTEDFLIIGSDGFWDVINEVHASHRIYQAVRENPSSANVIAEKLVLEAKSLRSRDNISVIVVFLTDPVEISSRPDDSHELLAKSNIYATFLLETNPQFAEMTDAYWKQPELLGEENRCFYEAPSNGKHANNAPDYEDEDEDEDLGPETNVDAVDEATEKCTKLEDLSRELFKEKTDERFEVTRDDDDDDSPPSPGIKSSQHVLIPEADNVADSEDSEDEWNYYKVDPNKEKDSAPDPVKESSEPKDEIKEREYPVSLEEDQERLPEREIEFGGSGDIFEKEKEADSPELIETDICPEETLREDSASTQQQHQEALDEMDFQLNPNAAEFVPVSPPRPLQQRLNIGPDFPVSGSPLKRTPTMDDIPVPSQEEFEEEICRRPSEVEEKEPLTTENLQRTEFTDYLVDKQKASGVPGPGLDVSEISSTKAEFGDESSTSFMTATDFHKTGVSVMDDSFGGSERQEYDIARDPMAMSFTPADFEAAFEKSVDLNAVHDLHDADLVGCQNGFVPEDRPVAQSPDIHLELATLITPETDHPPHTEPFPDPHTDSLLDVSSPADHQEVLESTLIDGKESRTRDTSKILDIELERHSSTDQNFEMQVTEQTSESGAPVPESELFKLEASPVPDLNQDLAKPLGNGVDFDLHQNPSESAETPDIITMEAQEVPETHQQDIMDIQSLVSSTQQATPVSPGPDTAETVSPQPLEPEISSPISQDEQICTLPREESYSSYFKTSPQPIPVAPFVTESPELKVQSEETIEKQHVAPEVDVMQNPLDLNVQSVSSADTIKSELETSGDIDFAENWNKKFETIQNPFMTETFSSPLADAVPQEAPVQECPFKISQHDSSKEVPPQEIDNKVTQSEDHLLFSITADNKGPQENGIQQIEVAKVDELTPKHGIIDSNFHHIETHKEDISSKISGLDLSESLQEFTGLEKELEPEQIEIEKVNSQHVSVDAAEEAVEEAIVPEVAAKEAAKPLEPVAPSVHEEKVIVEDVPKDTPSPGAIQEIVTVPKIPEVNVEVPKDTLPSAAAEPAEEKSQAGTAVAAVAAAGTAAAVAATAATRGTKTSKAKPAPKGTKAPVTSKPALKSSPTSPVKSLTPKTTSTAAKKPPLSTVSRPKQLDAKSSPSSTVTKTALSPKPNPPKAASSRLSATGPKPKTGTTTKPPAPSTDKKATPNGDVKPPAKPAASRLTGKPAASTTATKSTLVKSSTTSRPMSGTCAPKPRPTSAAPASKPLTKGTTGTTSTAAARPKTAPTTSTVTKTRLSATSSPVTDKQIKETANKQISSARTSSVSATKTARATGTTTTSSSTSSTTIKRTAGKPTTGSSPPARKPAPITRPGAKFSATTKPSTKSSVTAGKSTTTQVIQNGVSELQESKTTVTTTTTSNNIEEDVPKKDVSPVAPPSDNQLIMAAD
ncbi:mucin-17 isoform X2 [Cephus cinctus]|nr:mucin-17 isoform X2 [Cephus cinctus]XP_024944589.1 mucin-17 isoform X2 [Cephus cinctus]